MSFFVGGQETELDRITDAKNLMRAAPKVFGPRFDAIADLRRLDDGSLHRGNEFRRVASLVSVPLGTAMEIVAPNFFKNKRDFYAWLANHEEYRTYDKRGADHPIETFVGGLPVLWNVKVPEKQVL
jgi:hypothetical protein